MSEEASLPRFPIPFWDKDTVMSAGTFPADMDVMVMAEPRTILERNLDRFTQAVREKARWWEKVHMPDVIARWRAEAARQGIEDKTFDFALQQLRHQASQCSEDGIRPSPVPGVFESDSLLNVDLREAILTALKPLEDVPAAEKDWHPGSNEQVLDLVHPSLFPLVYGLSRCTTAARPPPQRSRPVHAPPPSASDATTDPEDADATAPAGGHADGDKCTRRSLESSGTALRSLAFSVARTATGWAVSLTQWPWRMPVLRFDRTLTSMTTRWRSWLRDGNAPDDVGTVQLELGPGQTAEERQAIATAVAAATPWHTPAFSDWKTKMGTGVPITDPPTASPFVSDRFQWLPADVLVGADGRVVFDSYVNNMHPDRHAALYAATARLLERMLPLLERTLSASAQRPQRVAQVEADCDAWWQPDIRVMWKAMKETGKASSLVAVWRAPEGRLAAAPGNACDESEAGGMDEDQDEDGEFDEFYEQIEEVWRERREFIPPVLPDVFEPLPPPPPVDLKRRRLQVIVKYAEVVLTPEQPEYGGGVWHVEGIENEAIVASCIAYLASDNISESRLHFRRMILDPYGYAQNDGEGVEKMYGLTDHGPMNELLDDALCVPGRMLCWPNAWQHRVAPFQLSDPSRPGVRKFAAVFLVDPHVRVVSTRDVPPQQMEWHDAESRLGSTMPEEVKRKVDALREFPLSLEQAKAARLELMDERRTVVRNTNHEVYGRTFSLCEH